MRYRREHGVKAMRIKRKKQNSHISKVLKMLLGAIRLCPSAAFSNSIRGD
jgi:hypothetical protein